MRTLHSSEMLVEDLNAESDLFRHHVGSAVRLIAADDGSEEPRGVLN
jgi:hypothetical protein